MAKNKYCCRDGYVHVYMSNTDDIMLADYKDWKRLKRIKWHVDDKGYAKGKLKGKKLVYHRVVTECPDELVVDHINHNKLNNLNKNLRSCTVQENNCNRPVQKNNTSGTPGVSWNKKDEKWKVEIYYYGNYKYLGSFEDYGEAVTVRRLAEKKYFKEFAPVTGG